jgi:hypothetical protein
MHRLVIDSWNVNKGYLLVYVIEFFVVLGCSLGVQGVLKICLMFGQMILMFLLDSPVPGTEMELFTPESLALSVSWKGPSLNDLVNDLTPCSVMLNPAIVLSKLIGDFLVIR